MKTGRKEKCWWCGEWAICLWSMDPIARRCEACIAEYEAFIGAA